MSIFKMKFYFKIHPRLYPFKALAGNHYISSILNNWPIKFKFLSEENKEKCRDLLSILIFELNQKNSVKIMDGRDDFEVKLFIYFMKTSWLKVRHFKRMSLLRSILLWNLNFLPKCLPIRNSGITFQSGKSSSKNPFPQEHCIRIILCLKSTLFIPLFS